SQLAAIAESSDRPPVDAQIKVTSRGFAATPAVNGSSFDYQSSTSEIAARLGQLDAPAEPKVTVTPTVLAPSITDAAAPQPAAPEPTHPTRRRASSRCSPNAPLRVCPRARP